VAWSISVSVSPVSHAEGGTLAARLRRSWNINRGPSVGASTR
jgi:hypothetical protein